MIQFSSVQWPHGLQHARLPCSSLTPRAYSQLMSIESVMPSNHLILCWPLLLPLSIFPSIRVFSNESVLHIRWSKYWSFSFSISPSKEYSGLISFRTRNGNNCLFSTQYWTPILPQQMESNWPSQRCSWSFHFQSLFHLDVVKWGSFCQKDTNDVQIDDSHQGF